ncbi:MAG: hypothetical protein ACLS7Z_02480 [Christensenellales bacterium]
MKRARSAALDEEIAKNERDALANRTKIIELTRQLGQKEEALQTAQEEAREAEEKLEAHKSAIIDAMNRLSDVRTSEARLSTMRKELERRGEEADAQREELAQAAQRMDEQLAQADGELEQAKRGEAERLKPNRRSNGIAGKRAEDRRRSKGAWRRKWPKAGHVQPSARAARDGARLRGLSAGRQAGAAACARKRGRARRCRVVDARAQTA